MVTLRNEYRHTGRAFGRGGHPCVDRCRVSLTPRGRPVAERLIELFAHIEDQIPDVVDTRREFGKRARQS